MSINSYSYSNKGMKFLLEGRASFHAYHVYDMSVTEPCTKASILPLFYLVKKRTIAGPMERHTHLFYQTCPLP